MSPRSWFVTQWTAVLLTAAGAARGDGLPDRLDRYRHVPPLYERLRAAPRNLSQPPAGVLGPQVTRNPRGTISQEFRTPVVHGSVDCIVYWHGSLVIAGPFQEVGPAPIRTIARWDGTSWQAIGELYSVEALAVWQGQLIASEYGRVERWNGARWEQLIPNLNGLVTTLTPTDSALVFAGYFSDGSGYNRARVGRWNGTQLTWMGGTLATPPNTIVPFQGDWYAGRSTGIAGAQDALMRFDGTDWQPFGEVTESNGFPSVQALSVVNGELLVGGWFDTVGTVAAGGIARWNGVSWAAVPGAGSYGTVFAMTMEGDSVVHVSGQLSGLTGLYRWNGSALAAEPGPDFAVALAVDGSRLAAAGPFDEVDGRNAFNVAERGPDGWHALEDWQPPMRGLAGPGSAVVRQFVPYDGGIVASGYFTAAANDTGWIRVPGVAMWKNSAWHAMDGLSSYEELVLHDGQLFAVNYGVRRWNGVGWEGLGGWVNGAHQGSSAGGHLYIGGSSTPNAFGGVWRWDDPQWTSLPQPDGVPEIADVAEMIADGANLIVSWTWLGFGRITSWDGAQWTDISDVFDGTARALATWNGRLLVGFEDPRQPLMVREAGVWKSTGLTGSIRSLTTLGPWLVAAGSYLEGPGIRWGPDIVAWDGSTWASLPIPHYAVHAVLGDGQSLWSSASYYGSGQVGSVVGRWDWDGRVPVVPVNSFASVAPNPFSTTVTLRLSLARLGNVRVAIYDIAGHEVARLWNDVMGAGEHTLTWDGRDRKGHPAPAGVYFARLLLDDRSAQSQRIVLMR